MKIITEETTSGELKTGDFYSPFGQEYWDKVLEGKKESLAEKIYIRTAKICPPDQRNQKLFKLIIKV